MKITIIEPTVDRYFELQDIYTDAGWNHYINDSERFKRCLNNSLQVLVAYDDNKTPIGIIRLVGDGEVILFIQDIIVKKDYQRNGVGSSHSE